MRLAIVSDIHGNLEALEAVLADLGRRDVGAIACLGDFVGYGASPNECVARLRPLLEVAVLGNHDAAAIGRLRLGSFHSDAAAAARWTAGSLSPESRAFLEGLPLAVGWRGLWLVHASPSSPQAWHYVLSAEDAAEELPAFDGRVCVVGHSHLPGAYVEGRAGLSYTREPRVLMAEGHRYIVNAGSVGQPRDGDPRAAYLLVDDTEGEWTHVRVDYDVEGAMAKIRAAGLPAFLAERLRWGE
jgi:diadenosine tetraphosphatase ApaH/serine/threonine PP2A family protein phosphatase